MLKNIVKFEVIIDGKNCCAFLENDTPIAIAKEFGFIYLKYLGQLEDQIKSQQEKSCEAPISEEIKNEIKEEDGNQQ